MARASDFDDIAARLRAFQRTADPDQLWPDVPRAARLDGHRRIVSATRAVLLGDHAWLEAADDATARAIGIAGVESGMGPLLGWWVERGLVQTSPPLGAIFATHLAHGRSRANKLRAATHAMLSAFRERSMTPVLLKGAHTAYAYFPDPGTRAGADIDVLVEPEQLELARQALRARGLVESHRTVRPFRSEWTPAGSTQVVRSLDFTHADSPWAIDLRTTLDRPYLGNLRASLGTPSREQIAPYAFDELPAAVLRQPLLVAYLAIHAAWGIHQIQLVRLGELGMVLRDDSAHGLLDPESLASLLRRTGTDRFAYPALALAEHLVPGTVHPQVLGAVEAAPSRTARRVVAALADSGSYRLPHRSVEEKLMWAKGLREQLLALVHGAWPLGETSSLPDGLALLRRRAWMLLRRQAGFLAPSGLRPEHGDQGARGNQAKRPGTHEQRVERERLEHESPDSGPHHAPDFRGPVPPA